MNVINISFQLVLVLLLSTIVCSCQEKPAKILHLQFVDDFGSTYNIMDSAKKHPLSDVAVYFLIDKRDPEKIKIKDIETFIKNNSFLQNEIQKSYYKLTAIFFHKSKNTDDLLKFQSQKALTLCSNDVFVEYSWLNGKPSDTLYYKNGIIEGADKIELQDVKD
jgi:hypothetical protein